MRLDESLDRSTPNARRSRAFFWQNRMNAWQLFKHWIYQTALGLDQQLNATVLGFCAFIGALVTGKPGSPCFVDESLSAHAYRAEVAGKRWARFLRPPIDWVFSLWQKPDPTIKDYSGEVIEGHCERAFHKERLRRGLPPEYRNNNDA
jgi:hypothetical protein